nr:MAG TPA: hypothetical protein [Caudoviricetes sp.]
MQGFFLFRLHYSLQQDSGNIIQYFIIFLIIYH